MDIPERWHDSVTVGQKDSVSVELHDSVYVGQKNRTACDDSVTVIKGCSYQRDSAMI